MNTQNTVAPINNFTAEKISRRFAWDNGKAVNSFEKAVEALPVISREKIFDGTGKEIPGTLALFNADSRHCLGIHGDGFTFLQPEETAEIMRAAVETISGAQWHSAVVTRFGARVRLYALCPKLDIVAPKRGDKVAVSLSMIDGFDGTCRTSLGLSAGVVACTNGAMSRENIFTFSAKHTGSLKDKIAAIRLGLAVKWQNAVEELRGIVTKLDNKPMRQTEVDAFTRKLFGIASEKELREETATQTRKRVESIRVGFVRGTGNVGRTAWDAFNAVTENIDWQANFRETEFSAEENRLESILSGPGANLRERALELLLN